MAKHPYDPLRRDVPASDVPLQSPMPRSPILDREEPEAADEADIAPESRPDPRDTP